MLKIKHDEELCSFITQLKHYLVDTGGKLEKYTYLQIKDEYKYVKIFESTYNN